jgi:hypothetical protein
MRKQNNEEVFFDIVNRTVSDPVWMPKFTTPNHIKIFPSEKKYEFRQEDSLCIVYVLWENLTYLKLAYLSLLTQIKYTDALTFDVRFYVHSKIYAYAVKILGSLIDVEKIVQVEGVEYMRYYLCETLQEEYETVVFCDSDAFMLGNPKNDFYRGLKKLSDEKLNRIICKAPTTSVREALEHRRCTFGRMPLIAKDRKDMVEFFSRITKISRERIDELTSGEGIWPLGGFHIVGNHLFKEDREDFSMWSNVFMAIDYPCDETFWKLWVEKYSYEIFDLEKNSYLTWTFDMEREDYYIREKAWLHDGTTHFFHPFVGRNCEYPQLLEFFEWIQFSE